jgi:hypothetical protein
LCLSQESVAITRNFKNIPCKVSKVVEGNTLRCIPIGEEINARLISVDTPVSLNNPKTRRNVEKTGMPMEEIIKVGIYEKPNTRGYYCILRNRCTAYGQILQSISLCFGYLMDVC